MKKVMSRNFIQKIVVAIVIVLSFNFVVPNFSRADFGGILMGPLIELIAGIGDVVMLAMEAAFGDNNNITLSTAGLMAQPDQVEMENRKTRYCTRRRKKRNKCRRKFR